MPSFDRKANTTREALLTELTLLRYHFRGPVAEYLAALDVARAAVQAEAAKGTHRNLIVEHWSDGGGTRLAISGERDMTDAERAMLVREAADRDRRDRAEYERLRARFGRKKASGA